MDTEKVTLTREKETLLITLYAKAGESRLPDSLLHDTFAAEAVRRIEYDFARLKVNRNMMVGLALRAKMLDDWTRDYLAANPGASVVHLGCGLDTRVDRVDPPSQTCWFDVDYPEVIALRRRLYAEERDNYHRIGTSLAEIGWVGKVPADRPALIVAEGLVMYLREEEVRRLFDALTHRIPNGELVFDALSPLGVRLVRHQPSVRATGASLHWGLGDPHELEAMVPKLTFVEEVAAYDPAQLARFSPASRIFARVVLSIPPLRRLGRFLRYRF